MSLGDVSTFVGFVRGIVEESAKSKFIGAQKGHADTLQLVSAK